MLTARLVLVIRVLKVVDYKFSFNLFVFKYFPNDMTDTKEDNSAVYFRNLKI